MQLLSGAAGGLSLGTGAEAASPETNQSNAPTIDRAALVQRHNPTLQAFDALAPLSVGWRVCVYRRRDGFANLPATLRKGHAVVHDDTMRLAHLAATTGTARPNLKTY